MVLHHRVEPTQVIGAAGGSHVVVVDAVIHRCRRRGHHPVVLMGIPLGLGAALRHEEQSQGQGHPCAVHRVVVWSNGRSRITHVGQPGRCF